MRVGLGHVKSPLPPGTSALGWQGGDRLTLTADAGVVTARRDPGGMITLPHCAYIAIPAALRRRCGLRPGDRVLLAAVPADNTLAVYSLAVVDLAMRANGAFPHAQGGQPMTTHNPPAASQQAAVDAALLLLERMGLSPHDLTAAPWQRPSVPAFADYVLAPTSLPQARRSAPNPREKARLVPGSAQLTSARGRAGRHGARVVSRASGRWLLRPPAVTGRARHGVGRAVSSGGAPGSVGVRLARVEAEAALTGLLRRFPALRLAAAESLTWRHARLFRSLRSLVHWSEDNSTFPLLSDRPGLAERACSHLCHGECVRP